MIEEVGFKMILDSWKKNLKCESQGIALEFVEMIAVGYHMSPMASLRSGRQREVKKTCYKEQCRTQNRRSGFSSVVGLSGAVEFNGCLHCQQPIYTLVKSLLLYSNQPLKSNRRSR